MSREVLGQAPADAGEPLAPPHATGSPGSAARPRRLRRVLALAAAAVTGCTSGWLLAGTAETGNLTGSALGVTAQVVIWRPDFASARPLRGTLQVSVINAGARSVRVTGYDASVSAASIAGLERPAGIDAVPAGQTSTLALRVSVRCDGELPLRLPSLRLRLADGTQRPLPVLGGNAAVAGLCSSRRDQQLLVSDRRPHRDREYYGVLLRSPSGRPTRVQAARAGGYPISVAPLPSTIGAAGTMIWLTPPARCPQVWRTAGFPGGLDLDVDLPAGELTTVSVEVGPALARWLLDSGCPEGAT
jgi:hypothetical protein